MAAEKLQQQHQCEVKSIRLESYLEMCHTRFVPQARVSEELAWFLTDLLAQSLESSSIIQLVQEPEEELDVACRVNEMSTSTLIFRLPHLDRHGFGEYLLGELKLRCQGSHVIVGRFFIDGSSRLSQISKRSRQADLVTHPQGHSVVPIRLVGTSKNL